MSTYIYPKRLTLSLLTSLSLNFNTNGIRGIPLQWLKNYLSNRLQYVQINDCESETMTVKLDVPQGTDLGPLLFLLYVIDIQKCIYRAQLHTLF